MAHNLLLQLISFLRVCDRRSESESFKWNKINDNKHYCCSVSVHPLSLSAPPTCLPLPLPEKSANVCTSCCLLNIEWIYGPPRGSLTHTHTHFHSKSRITACTWTNPVNFCGNLIKTDSAYQQPTTATGSLARPICWPFFQHVVRAVWHQMWSEMPTIFGSRQSRYTVKGISG